MAAIYWSRGDRESSSSLVGFQEQQTRTENQEDNAESHNDKLETIMLFQKKNKSWIEKPNIWLKVMQLQQWFECAVIAKDLRLRIKFRTDVMERFNDYARIYVESAF